MSERIPHLLQIRASIDFPEFRLEVDNEFELAGITGLFGPSGGGKSTLLRIIAGLEPGAHGLVRFGGETWQDESRAMLKPAWQRPVGYVFQDARLFPHLSAGDNLRYAEARRGDSGRPIEFEEAVAALELDRLLDRGVDDLSGGEQQRVAIARTLLANPRLLLLDEPLAGLDHRRKSEIIPYLETLPERFGLPVIYVSHSVSEMARLADDVVVLNNGSVVATGPGDQVFGSDVAARVDSAVEAITVLEVTVIECLPDQHLTRVEHRGHQLTIPAIATNKRGDKLRLVVRSGDVVLATAEPAGLSVRNVLKGTVQKIEAIADGPFADVIVDIDGTRLVARLTRHAVSELGLAVGQQAYALIKTASFDRRL